MSFENPRHVRPRRRTIVLPVWASYGLMALFVVGVVSMGYFTFNGMKEFMLGLPVGSGQAPILGGPDDPTQLAGTPGAPDVVWTGGQVNILLLGIDQRASEEGPWRTDTMILVTLDPAGKRAGILSMPRDLWVEIPDYNVYDRINTAHFRGDADQYPGGGGPALAMRTVQSYLGIPVGYYIEINFYAFLQAVDKIGCIPITVSEEIDDPTYPALDGFGFDPFHISPGNYCMNGDTLLKYARTRATFGSDFDRAARQQQVLYAIRDQVLNTGQLPNLIAQAPEIYQTVQSGVKTNFSLEQLIELAKLAPDIPRENICSAVISGEYIESMAVLADESQVLIPDQAKVRQLVVDLQNGTGVCSPGGEDLAGQAAAERASVYLVNGTQREGLATETGNMLRALGINIVSVGNADRVDYDHTIIYSYKGKTFTARYIARLLDVPESAIVDTPDPAAQYDIQVVLGADYQQ